mgnify:CR=1 FL=1
MTNKSYCSNIEDVCINYMINKNFNRNKLTKCVAYIQEKIENNDEKNYILRKNDFVYKNLVKNIKLEEYITEFFVKKLLLICKYKNNPYYNLNIEDLKFIQKFKTKQAEFDDFDYYFFIYILKDFNNFISKKKEKIFIEHKHKSIYFGDRLYYNILNKIFLKLNCEKEEYINMLIKKEYLCPISNDLINEPVKTKYGHIFEKSCIEKWLEIKKSCPLTRKYLNINDCVLQKNLKMRKYIILPIALLILFFTAAQPAVASFCRNYKENRICILSIKRSAKNYWEYRAEVSINDVRKPLEIYNCRTQQKIQKNGRIVKFESNGAGQFICSVLDK